MEPEQKKETVFPLLSVLWGLLLLLRPERGLFLALFLCVPRAHFCDLHCLEFKLDGVKGKQKQNETNQETLIVYILSFCLLPQFTCYYLLPRVLKELCPAFFLEGLVTFGERDWVQYTYSILPRTITQIFNVL